MGRHTYAMKDSPDTVLDNRMAAMRILTDRGQERPWFIFGFSLRLSATKSIK
jgi:hypothetical protein